MWHALEKFMKFRKVPGKYAKSVKVWAANYEILKSYDDVK